MVLVLLADCLYVLRGIVCRACYLLMRHSLAVSQAQHFPVAWIYDVVLNDVVHVSPAVYHMPSKMQNAATGPVKDRVAARILRLVQFSQAAAVNLIGGFLYRSRLRLRGQRRSCLYSL